MELITTRDILLKGTYWDKAIAAYSSIFSSRPFYNLFLLSASIGIMYDTRISKPEENGEMVRTLPRNVIDNQECIRAAMTVILRILIIFENRKD